MTNLRTGLCDRLGIELPIVQAPIGGGATPALAAAVSGAGGLGMLSITWKRPEDVRDDIRTVRQLTPRPFAVNLVLGFDPEPRLAAALAEEVGLVSFFWGDPSHHLRRVHDAGALAALTVGSAAEARDAVAAGVDIVVAQGVEAGGHVWGGVAALPLVPAVVDAVRPVPVVAAGGIADGRGLAAVLCLGAQAAWLGTRFVASQEARAHEAYKRLIIDAAETGTVHTDIYDLGWPGAPERVLVNETTRRWQAAGKPGPDARPNADREVARRGDGSPVPAYSVEFPTPDMEGEVGEMALYAGQSAGLIHEVRPAAEIVARIAAEARTVLAGLA